MFYYGHGSNHMDTLNQISRMTWTFGTPQRNLGDKVPMHFQASEKPFTAYLVFRAPTLTWPYPRRQTNTCHFSVCGKDPPHTPNIKAAQQKTITEAPTEKVSAKQATSP
jgi:hypothetical protein